MTESLNDEVSADIVAVMLQLVQVCYPQMEEVVAARIEQQLRAQFGGKKVRIPKRGKYLTEEQRRALFTDGLSGMSTPEIVQKHNTSRATLYRLMKKGGRFGGA